jgi:hypothetical protein
MMTFSPLFIERYKIEIDEIQKHLNGQQKIFQI